MKGIYDQSTTNIILSGERPNAFPQLGKRQGCPLKSLVFDIILAVLASAMMK